MVKSLDALSIIRDLFGNTWYLPPRDPYQELISRHHFWTRERPRPIWRIGQPQDDRITHYYRILPVQRADSDNSTAPLAVCSASIIYRAGGEAEADRADPRLGGYRTKPAHAIPCPKYCQERWEGSYHWI